MGKYQETFVINFGGKTDEIDNTLDKLQARLQSLVDTGAAKGLEKALTGTTRQFDKFLAKANQPVRSAGTFNTLSDNVSSLSVSYGGLYKQLTAIEQMNVANKLKFLPKEEQDKIEKFSKAVATFTKDLKAAKVQSDELTQALKNQQKTQKDLENAQNKLNSKKSILTNAQDAQKAVGERLKPLEQTKQKVVETAEVLDKLDKYFKKNPNADKRKKVKLDENTEITLAAARRAANNAKDKETSEATDYSALTNEFNSFNSVIKEANSAVKEWEAKLATAQQNADNTTKAVQQLNQQFEQESAQKSSEAFDKFSTVAETLGVDISSIDLNTLQTNSEQLTQVLTNLINQALEPFNLTITESKEDVKNLNDLCQPLQETLKQNKDAFEDENAAAGEIQGLINRAKAFFGIQGAAALMRKALTNAISTVKELDAQMTEMAVVTDLNVGGYWDQLPEYTKRANELGVSIKSAYEAATLYYQQGLNNNEVQALSNATLKMARIAGLSAADATDKMTSALRGFNMELNEVNANRVADVYSKLAAITASNVEEISSAMSKTASIAASAGMEFETTASFLAAAIETTREDADAIGTALKTITARFQELKKAPSEIGEVDGEIVDANKIETALRSVGIALRDTNGQFRDLDDVFLELSSKWNTLDKNTQRYISTMAAGSRQQSRFIAMMQDYSRTQELVNAANNAEGASTEQYNKTLESLETQLTQLKNAWDEFTMSLLNSELIKVGIKTLTTILNIINKITGVLGDTGSAVSKIALIVAALKLGKIMINKFAVSITKAAGPEGEKAGEAYGNGLIGAIKKKIAQAKGLDKTATTAKADAKSAEKQQKTKEEKAKNKTEEAKTQENNQAQEDNNQLVEETVNNQTKLQNAYNATAMAAMAASAALGVISTIMEKTGATKDAIETVDTLSNGLGIMSMVLMGIPPLLKAIGVSVKAIPIVGWIAAAITALITLYKVIRQYVKTDSEKLTALQDAATAAGEEATSVKKSYDELLNSQTEYNKLQETLDDLTYGTQEWKTALIEANNQVLELLRTYPKLAEYLGRGAQGQLTISDEGWNAVIEQQQQAVARTQSRAAIAQMNVSSFQNKLATKRMLSEIANNSLDQDSNAADRTAVLNKMAELYESNPEAFALDANGEYSQALKDLAKEVNATTDNLYNMGDALADYMAEVDANTAAMRAQAKVALQAGASTAFGTYQYSSQILDTFANTMTSTSYQDKVARQAKGMVYNKNVDTDEFRAFAAKYGVEEKSLTGDDKKDLRTVYAAMTGQTYDEVKKLGKSKQELAQAIAEIDSSEDLTTAMNDFQSRLAKLSKQAQREIAATLSESGRSMTAAMLDNLLTDGQVDKSKVERFLAQQAKELQYDSIENYAKSIGKTTEELIKEIEKNGKAVAAAQEQITNILTNAGIDEEVYKGFSTEVRKAIANQLDIVSDASGREAASALNQAITSLVSSLSVDDQNKVGSLISTTVWKDLDAINNIPSLLDDMGVSIPTNQLNDFLKVLQTTAKSIPTSDFDTLNKKLSSTGEILKNIESGEQGRTFSEEDYKSLVSANSALVNQFYKNINGEFVYLGGSMDNLRNSVLELNNTLSSQVVSTLKNKVIAGQTVSGLADNGSLISDYLNFAPAIQREYLNAFINNFKSYSGADLSTLGIARLSNDTNINDLDDTAVNEILTAIKKISDDYDTNISNLSSEIIEGISHNYETRTITSNTTEAGFMRNSLTSAGLENNYDSVEVIQAKAQLKAYTNAITSQALAEGISENDINEYRDAVNAWEKAFKDKDNAALEEANQQLHQLEKKLGNIGSWKKAKTAASNLMNKIQDVSDGYSDLTSEINRVDKAQDAVSDFGINVSDAKMADRIIKLALGYSQGDYQSYLNLIKESQKGWADDIQEKFKGLTEGDTYDTKDLSAEALAKAEQMALRGIGKFEQVSATKRIFRLFSEEEIASLAENAGTALEEWENPYNWLYNINEQINALIRERTRLEKEWEAQSTESVQASLDIFRKDLAKAQEEISAYQEQAVAYIEKAEKLARDNAKYLDFYNYDIANGQLTIDYEGFEKTYGNNSDERESFESFIGKLEDNRDGLQNTLDAIEDLADELKSWQTKGQEAYVSLINEIRDALVDQYQAEIDKLSSINDTINEVQGAIVDKIQEQIDDARSAREREEAKQNLENQYAQLAYLQASGASSLDILKLQDEISSAEQDYTDSLIDSGISEITKANEQAADQRQQQIDLAQAQLDNYSTGKQSLDEATRIYQEAMEKLSNGLSITDTKVFEILNNSGKVVSQAEMNTFVKSLTEQFSTSALYTDENTKNQLDEDLNALTEGAKKIKESLDKIKEIGDAEKSTQIDGTVLTNKLDEILAALGGLKKWRDESDAKAFGREILSEEEFNKLDKSQKEAIGLNESSSYSDYVAAEQTRYQKEGSEGKTLKEELPKSKSDETTEDDDNNGKSLGGGGTNTPIYKQGVRTDDGPYAFDGWVENYYKKTGNHVLSENAFGGYKEKGGLLGYEDYDAYLKDKYNQYISTVGNSNETKLDEITKYTAVNDEENQEGTLFQSEDGLSQATMTVRGASTYTDTNGNKIWGRQVWFSGKGDWGFGYDPWVNLSQPLSKEDAEAKGFDTSDTTGVHHLQKASDGWYIKTWVPKNGKDWKDGSSLAWSKLIGWDEKINELLSYHKFKTGGLADFTGPAWLDGTKSSPELVLNSTDTANFIQLKDILSSVLHNVPNKSQNTNQGNNYYDIDISVDEIADDYDVDTAADRIKELIVNDAMYRNVNAVNNIR